MSTIRSGHAIDNAQPFAGQGASLYVTAGETVRYRRMRIAPRGRTVLRQGWSGRNPKTTRVAVEAGVSDDTITFDWPLPPALADTALAVNVRHFRDGHEHLSIESVPLTVDAVQEPVLEILGAAKWLMPEQRSGGVLRLRWRWLPSMDGVQPDQFRVEFTAGPDSPSDITLPIVDGVFEYATNTGPLLDSGPYTVRLSAESGATTAVLFTGDVQADATGPAAPTLISARAV